VNAVVTICMQESLNGEIFNIGSGIGRTLNSLVDLVRETLAINPVVMFDQKRDVDAPYNVLDCSHIFSTIGWKPKYDFPTTIRNTWAFMQKREINAGRNPPPSEI